MMLPTFMCVNAYDTLRDIGSFIGAVATFFAVITSLYLASKANRATAHIAMVARRDPVSGVENEYLHVTNIGVSPISIGRDSLYIRIFLRSYRIVIANDIGSYNITTIKAGDTGEVNCLGLEVIAQQAAQYFKKPMLYKLRCRLIWPRL